MSMCSQEGIEIKREFRFLFLLDIGAKIEKPVNDNIMPNDPIPIQSNGIF